MLIGRTGSGKSFQVIIPQAVERLGESAIITEAVSGAKAPVVYQNTAGFRQLAGHEIIYFNPGDLCSTRINPIDLVRSFDDAQHLANLIVQNTTSDTHFGDDVWVKSETHLLQSLLLHAAGLRADLRQQAKPGDGANLCHIRCLLRLGPQGVQEALEKTRLDIARKEFYAYMNATSTNFRYGVISGLTQRLSLFINPNIAALTEVTDFDIESLKSKLFSVYLATPIHRPENGPLAAMMFNFFLSLILKDIENLKHPLMLLLDEFTNFGYLPGITRYTTVIRNAGIGALFGVQSMAQLEKLYKEKDAKILFSQAATKIFFAADGDDASVISKMLGNTTVKERVNANGSLSNRESPAPLLDVADISGLEKTDEFLALTPAGPIRLKKTSTWDTYKYAMERECRQRPRIIVNDDLEAKNTDNREQPKVKDNKPPTDKDESTRAGWTGAAKKTDNSYGSKNKEKDTDGSHWERIERDRKARANRAESQPKPAAEIKAPEGKVEDIKDPNISCAAFRIALEKRLLKLAGKAKPEIEKSRMTVGELLEWIRQENLLPPWETGLIREFIKTLNKGVHGRLVDAGFIDWIKKVGPGVIEILDKRFV